MFYMVHWRKTTCLKKELISIGDLDLSTWLKHSTVTGYKSGPMECERQAANYVRQDYMFCYWSFISNKFSTVNSVYNMDMLIIISAQEMQFQPFKFKD
jgi:hypothetical protein